MQLRVATEDDLERIYEVEAFVLLHPGANERFLRSLADNSVFLAVDGERISGMMAVEYGFYGHAFVAFLAVDPYERRRGIASALLRHAETLARKGKVFASTTASNDAMIGVFAKCGWQKCGSLTAINDDGEEELIFVRTAATCP